MQANDDNRDVRRARAGYVLVVSDAGTAEELWQMDCVRCGVTMCEASPHTIADDPWRLLNKLRTHEATHNTARVVVEVVR